MPEPLVLPGRRGFQIAAPASCFEEFKEIAWEAAKERIVPRPDMGWIMSNYVDLSPPEDLRPNENGHIFTLADGEKAYSMVRDTPLNWLHHAQFIVGHYVDVELLYHLDDEPAVDAEGNKRPPGAHIETLSAFYRSVYPKQWTKVRDAHEAGLLHESMEAVPESVTCMKEDCCGETFPFAGAWSDTYCDSMQKPGRKFILNNPLFIGGAVVVPPHRPGWRDASAIEVATYIETHQAETEELFANVAAMHPGLDDAQAEAILVALLEAAGAGEGTGRSRMSLASTSGTLNLNLPSILSPATDAAVVARADTLEAEANLQGVIVALVPPPDVTEALAELGDEPVDEIHVTLAFLGDSNGEDELPCPEGPVTVDRLNAMVAVFAASERPVTARVSGLGRFDAPGDSEVTYASIDAPGLNELRARLVEYLSASGVPVAMNHGFSPHATVQYHRPGEGPTELPDGLEWEVDSISLWWGSAVRTSHPLGGARNAEEVAATLAIEAVAAVDADRIGDELAVFTSAARLETLAAVLAADRGDPAVLTAVYEALVDRKFSNDERAELAKKGQAMPDGSFPTPTKADWMNARAAIGRADPKDRAKVIAYLKRRAEALGIPDDEIPDNW